MPFNHNFWKQIQSQQKRRPSLSEVYTTLLENQNVALYSKEIGDATSAPPAPDGTESVAVVSRDYLSQIKSLAGFQSTKNKDILSELFKDKAGISEKFSKALVPVIKNALEASGYESAVDLFAMSIGLNGFFDIASKEVYNVIEETMSGVEEYASDAYTDGLRAFLQNILPDTTKYASTNVGPGELFFVLFSNAKVSSSGGKKSGDLEAEGVSIEVKSSGARMNAGPSRLANHASLNVNKFLKNKNQTYTNSSFFEREKNELCDKLKEVLNQSNTVQDFLNNSDRLLDNDETHSQVTNKFKNNLFKPLRQLLSELPSVNWEVLVNKGSGKQSRQVGGVQLRFYVYNRLEEIQKSYIGKESVDKTETQKEKIPKQESNLVYLLANTFEVLKKMDINTISKEDLIKIILFTNSYTEQECNSFGYSIMNDLTDFLSDKTVEQILKLSTGALLNLVGAMQLASYSLEMEFDKILFLNKESGKVLIQDAPKDLVSALRICRRPDIKIDPVVDSISKGTIYGSTCKYYFE